MIKKIRILSIVLVVSILNLNLSSTGHVQGKQSISCSCYTEFGRCSSMHLCDCCIDKLSPQYEENEGSCHSDMGKRNPESVTPNRASSSDVTICRLGCSTSHDSFFDTPVDPRILVKSPTVQPGSFFSICKVLLLIEPVTPYINPPEKPPRFTV